MKLCLNQCRFPISIAQNVKLTNHPIVIKKGLGEIILNGGDGEVLLNVLRCQLTY